MKTTVPSRSTMDIDTELWSDLIVSILSVNNYPLEKAYARVADLQREGLCSIDNLSRWRVEEITERLTRAGVNRGSFMNALYAKRLSALGIAIISKMNIVATEDILRTKNREAISRVLLPIHGIGTQVVRNFLVLRDG
jgi:S-adenosylmethionine:diacylglycerol 3-amino-3-carboxypropyl transferase